MTVECGGVSSSSFSNSRSLSTDGSGGLTATCWRRIEIAASCEVIAPSASAKSAREANLSSGFFANAIITASLTWGSRSGTKAVSGSGTISSCAWISSYSLSPTKGVRPASSL